MDRIEIEIKLHRGRADALEAIAAMSEEERRAPRTRSEHDPDSWWCHADHFIHTTLIERQFNEMVRKHLRGEPAMDRNLVDETGASLRSLDDIMAYVHRFTEGWKVENQDKPLDELVRIGCAVHGTRCAPRRARRRAARVEDPRCALGEDGTVGGIMAVHTDHTLMHRHWAAEGTTVEA